MRFLVALGLLAPLLSGCAALGVGEGTDDGELRIAASFYPLAYVAGRVSEQQVDLLTTPGAEPHDFELTIKETAMVAGADLVVYERGFQPAVDGAVDETAEGEVVDAGDVGLEGDDPHFWLDPMRMAELGDRVAVSLGRVDEAHADFYLANADRLRRDMQRLDRQYAAGLADCERHTIVASHDAFGYLEKYGVHVEAIAGLSPDAEPTPAHLAQLQDLIADDGITTVFTERLGSRKMADTLADDLGLQTRVLDPIEGVAADSDEDYESLMRENLQALEEANGC